MALTKDEIIDGISQMSVLDLADLVKALQDKFGVSAAPMAVAAVPAAGGGLVVLASRLPAPDWLPADLDLDTPDAVQRLRLAAPGRRDLAVTPGWRRLRSRADLDGLDPGLEGWEATRALLSGR